MSVPIIAGATAFTRIPRVATSLARPLVNPMTPAFAGDKAECPLAEPLRGALDALVDVDQGDARALGDEAARDRQPDAAGGPRDQRRASVELHRRALPSRERLIEVLDQVVGVLESDAEAQQVLGCARPGPFDRGAMLDEALGSAEARRPREDTHLRRHGQRAVAV